jgi:hypothetical protein
VADGRLSVLQVNPATREIQREQQIVVRETFSSLPTQESPVDSQEEFTRLSGAARNMGIMGYPLTLRLVVRD